MVPTLGIDMSPNPLVSPPAKNSPFAGLAHGISSGVRSTFVVLPVGFPLSSITGSWN